MQRIENPINYFIIQIYNENLENIIEAKFP